MHGLTGAFGMGVGLHISWGCDRRYGLAESIHGSQAMGNTTEAFIGF